MCEANLQFQFQTMKNILQYGLTLLAIIAIIMWQTGYNPFAGAGKMGAVVNAGELKALKRAKESDGKRVAILGHATVSNSNLTRVIGRPTSIMVESPSGEAIDFVDFSYGQGANEYFLPETFTSEDLKLYDNDKREHAGKEDVRISFTMKRVAEAEPEINPTTGEYAWRYEQVRIDPADVPLK